MMNPAPGGSVILWKTSVPPPGSKLCAVPPKNGGALGAEWDSTLSEDSACSKDALITISSLIAGRREIRDTPSDNVINRLGDSAVLKERLGKVDYVIDDNFRSGGR